ncbi:glycoside hydrolase family 13 protein [Jeotgalibacillus haloalkalitolerans]|uniref:Alpha-glucosidase n=1 Tax=Jeotgalibacillus haloalkalitolerans TaxID=3104292 RepID=A0ABU5KHV2_9BACL|nr:alpha-glucosidase [Jeotgalibacillus sp. HH7-29]MDZ5710829.1 alpha-glucosidase [Jeotgalibacillus sp. HH7-29]
MKKTWWKEAVVYQVYWRSFYDSNGDGFGDLRGVLEKLDYIKMLGVDVIWLNPFYESPDRDNGYDISDYEAVMEKAGDLDTFKELLEAIHAKGMKVIMDLVVNHTSDQHPWFLDSKSSKDHPKRDWYIWREGKEDGPPNNWRSYFEPSTWTKSEETGEYYFHSFAKEQPDLNWENTEVRREIYRMMRSWLDLGIDGFRMDVINLLAKQEGFPDADNPDHISYLADNPGIHDYLQEMNREVLSHYDVMTVGEIPFVNPDTGLLYVHEDRNELNTLFHFQVADEMPVMDLPKYKEIQENWYKGIFEKGWNSQFLNNHDHTRQVTRYGNDGKYRTESAKLLGIMLHTLPGMPYIYQGEEIGMTGVRFDSIEDYNDIAMKNKYKEEVEKGRDPEEVFEDLLLLSRDNSRTPMQWNDKENAGFTKGKPWIRVNPNYQEINVEQALADQSSVFYTYQNLIELRKEHPVMVYGDYEDLSKGKEPLYMYKRVYKNTSWLIALNHSDQSLSLESPKAYAGEATRLVIGNYKVDAAARSVMPETLDLKPYEARVYEFVSAD